MYGGPLSKEGRNFQRNFILVASSSLMCPLTINDFILYKNNETKVSFHSKLQTKRWISEGK